MKSQRIRLRKITDAFLPGINRSVRYLCIIVCILHSTSVLGQRTELARSFYKKAQEEYAKEDYAACLSLLEKAKQELDNATTVDIIYLEGKTRYFNDMNVEKSRELLKEFLEQANSADTRIQEVADLLVDIELGKDFYASGIRKNKTGKVNDDLNYYAEFNAKGDTLRYQNLDDETEQLVFDRFYNDNKPVSILAYSPDGHLISFSRQIDEEVMVTYLYVNSSGEYIDREVLFKYTEEKKGPDGIKTQVRVPRSTTTRPVTLLIFKNSRIRQILSFYKQQDYRDFDLEHLPDLAGFAAVDITLNEWLAWTNNDNVSLSNDFRDRIFFEKKRSYVDDQFEENFLVKRIQYSHDNKFSFIYFDSDGLPEIEEVYKRGLLGGSKLLETIEFKKK